MLKIGGVSSEVVVQVGTIQPGMTPFTEDIEVKNRGEVKAKLGYEVKSLKILDEYYEAGVNGETSESLITKMSTGYPFKINVASDDSNLQAATGVGKFTVTVTWEYEADQDALDTEWGQKAYNFAQANANTGDENAEPSTDTVVNSIEIKLLLTAEQMS